MKNKELIILIKKASDGDMTAFAEIYKEFYNDIYYLCLKILKNSDNAADITQDVFVSAIENIAKLENEAAFEAWIKSIAVNKCKNFLKKSKPALFSQYTNEDDSEFIAEDENALNGETVFDDFETRRIINSIIDNLPDEQRICVILYYYDDKSISEIARFMECNSGTVKSRLNYARKKIRDEIERIERENNIYLHSASAIPLLGYIISKQMPKIVSMPSFDSVLNIAVKSANSTIGTGNKSEISADSGKNETVNIKENAPSAKSAAKAVSKKAAKTIAAKITAGILGAVVLVSGGMFAGSRISTDAKTTEPTVTTAPQTTTQAELTNVSNIKLSRADYYEKEYPDGAGSGYGITIDFDIPENADGYRLKYIFYNGTAYEDFDRTKNKLCLGGQSGPDSIEIATFKSVDGEIVFSEWAVLIDLIYGFPESEGAYTFDRWDELKKEYRCIDPYIAYEEQIEENY